MNSRRSFLSGVGSGAIAAVLGQSDVAASQQEAQWVMITDDGELRYPFEPTIVLTPSSLTTVQSVWLDIGGHRTQCVVDMLPYPVRAGDTLTVSFPFAR